MTDKKSSESRRKLLKSIAAGSGAVIAGKSLPESWSRPIVDSVMLPAHAQTSPPAPQTYEYYGTDITGEFVSNEFEDNNLFAGIMNTVLPEAHAHAFTYVISVLVTGGGTADVSFINHNDYAKINVSGVALDGTPSGNVSVDPSSCSIPSSGGPSSLQLINYTDGDATVLVQVNGGSSTFQYDVPMSPIGPVETSPC
jgi:hypothetical protein